MAKDIAANKAKNIVLLSDGTGNSSAKQFKSNVWRLYQALDCNDPDRPQVAYYDDGVGTETFKPLAYAGLAFGLGVWTNVRDLYTFLCRNYKQDAVLPDGSPDSDRIFVFGFSRGAFTARLLCGLVGKCGLVDWTTEAELEDNVELAYLAYRRDYLWRAAKRRWMPLQRWLVRPPEYEPANPALIRLPCGQRRANISFLGVWDTVDAYGMPLDEWKDGINCYVWPMSFADRSLSDSIDRACHALSLDDERPTFRPVLWTETDTHRSVGGGRLEQVWFAGVHSNVGGGYPDDGLAYCTLDWMMSKAEPALRFLPDLRGEVRERLDPHGDYYDSRSELSGYYRYGPRNLAALCHDQAHKVEIARTIIHPDAVARIAEREVSYAPVSLPARFDVGVGMMSTTPALGYDDSWMQLAWNTVLWRRLAYFCTLALTIVLVGFPFLERLGVLKATAGAIQAQVCLPTGLWDCGQLKSFFGFGLNLIDRICLAVANVPLIKLAANNAPAWSKLWVDPYLAYPVTAVILAALLAWLFFRKSEQLQDKIAARAEYAWAAVKGIAAAPVAAPEWSDRLASGMRKFASGYHLVTDGLVPLLFAILTLLLLVAAALITFPFSLYAVWRLWMFIRGTRISAADGTAN